MHKGSSNAVSLLVSLLLALSACHTPAPDAGFLAHTEQMKANKEIPFDAVWIKENTDLLTFKKIYVAEIDSSHLLQMSWWDKLSFAEGSKELDPTHEAAYLAKYFREHLIATFKETESNQFEVVDQPDHETLILELAIVEVVPTKVWLNSLSYLIAGALDTGATAIEGRFRAGQTQEVIFRFKDKRAGPYSLVNVGDFTWYSHAKDTIADWSTILVELCNRRQGEIVPSPLPFTLRPW